MTGKLTKFVLGSTILLACAELTFSAAGDWPQWRGPRRDNISTETGLLKDWPKEGPPLAWKAEGLGSGYSSVSVADGKIFTMGDHGDVADVEALDLTGKHLWTTPIGKSGGNHPGTRSTPTVDGEQVYAVGQYGDLVCLEAGTGKIVWHQELRGKDIGGSMGGWGYAESPLVDGDKLLCIPGGAQGTVAAFDKKTGALLWRSKDLTDGSQYSSLITAELGGKHQYVVFTGASVAGIAPDGKILWRAARKGKTAMVCTPVVDGDLVFVTSGYGIGCNCFKVTLEGNELKAVEIYANKDLTVHHGDVVCLDHKVYAATDRSGFTCMNIADGKVLWKEKSIDKGSVTYADGRLYARGEKSGDVALIEATGDGYKQHGLLTQPDRSKEKAWAHPVVAGGKLYLRDEDILLCYDIKAK